MYPPTPNRRRIPKLRRGELRWFKHPVFQELRRGELCWTKHPVFQELRRGELCWTIHPVFQELRRGKLHWFRDSIEQNATATNTQYSKPTLNDHIQDRIMVAIIIQMMTS